MELTTNNSIKSLRIDLHDFRLFYHYFSKHVAQRFRPILLFYSLHCFLIRGKPPLYTFSQSHSNLLFENKLLSGISQSWISFWCLNIFIRMTLMVFLLYKRIGHLTKNHSGRFLKKEKNNIEKKMGKRLRLTLLLLLVLILYLEKSGATSTRLQIFSRQAANQTSGIQSIERWVLLILNTLSCGKCKEDILLQFEKN